MTELNILDGLDQVVDEAVELGNVDHGQESSGGGGFERVLLETGVYPMYLCQYIEMGRQKFKGFEGGKDTFSDGVQYAFAVFDYDNADEEGNPRVAIVGTGFPIKMSQSPRAEFFKLFQALNYNADPNMKHMAKFLGKTHSYTGKVIKKKSKQGKEYNTIEVASLAPSMVGSRGQQVREVLPDINPQDYAVFLWDNPRMIHWDSIRRGKEGVSAGDPKNFIQYRILQATNFEGSAVDLMLRDAGQDTTVQPKSETKEDVPFDEDMPEEMDKPVATEKVVPATMPVLPTMTEEE